MPRARTSFADFSINPAASDRLRAGKRKPPTMPELDPAIDQIERTVRTIVADEMGIDFDQAALDASFLGLGCDELDVVEIVMHAEEAFGIEVDEDAIDGFVRVRDLVEYVRRRV